MADTAYKFLDYYEKGDQNIFFGRERETQILLSDVLVNRLVVLFARSGAGKTSLINAGVRPRLEDRDFATYYIRVERDPTKSARSRLRKENLRAADLEGESLAGQFKAVVEELDRPIVLFFDQFEEFFINIRDRKARGRFISDIADVYRDPDSGVHMVFSMREEYFHGMDEFRGEIPTIFNRNSNLRLGLFDDDQAREAIAGPARVFGVEIEKALEDQLVLDLAQEEGIEPARLQIVCDTLWQDWQRRGRKDGTISLEDYRELGRGSKNPAEWIYHQRLEEDIEGALALDQLPLFERLLPELRTEEDTKYPREFGNLVKALRTDPASLKDLVDRLLGIHLIRRDTLHGAESIEWVSDHLAGRSDDLLQSVRTISVRGRVRQAVETARLWDESHEVERDEVEVHYLSPDDFESLSVDFEGLQEMLQQRTEESPTGTKDGVLSQAEARFMFEAALQHGTHVPLWFQQAAESGVEVWARLEHKIEDETVRIEQAENSVRLLGKVGGAEALQLLKRSLWVETLSSLAIEVLAEMGTLRAMGLLTKALQEEALAPQIIDVLRRKRTAATIEVLARALGQDDVWALQAGLALDSIARGRPGRASTQARGALAEALAAGAPRLYHLALEQGFAMRFWHEQAAGSGVDVWKILDDIISGGASTEWAENVVRLLGGLGTEQAVELLEAALLQDPLALQAERELERIAEGPDLAGAPQARTTLEAWRQEQEEPHVAEPVPTVAKLPREIWKGLDNRDWALLLRRIEDGRCTPFLGPGVLSGEFPSEAEIAREWAAKYDYPLEGSGDLPQVAQYLAVRNYAGFPKELMGEEMGGVEPPDSAEPDEPHRLLASLPLPLYITTNYDDWMLRALREQHKAPKRELARWSPRVKDHPSLFDSDPGFRPTTAEPVVFHLLGHTEAPDSLVLTEDDHLDFLLGMSRDQDVLPLLIQRALASSSLLFMGYDLTGWQFRLLFRGLVTFTESALRRLSVAVLAPPNSVEAGLYIREYLDRVDVRIYWGTLREFAADLRERWEGSSDDV